MKSFFAFLFGYGQLSWKSRLTRADHMYHQGRNALSLILCLGYALLMLTFMPLLLSGVLTQTSGSRFWLEMAVLAAFIFVAFLPLFYVAFATIKLTILRLHDFNLSGWWMLGIVALALVDTAMRYVLPNFDTFVSFSNLAYLALLILPASAEPNRFGTSVANSTAGKMRWIRAVPLVAFFGLWFLGMADAFLLQQQAADLQAMRAQGPDAAQMEEFLRQLHEQNAIIAPAVSESAVVTPTAPANAPATISPTTN